MDLASEPPSSRVLWKQDPPCQWAVERAHDAAACSLGSPCPSSGFLLSRMFKAILTFRAWTPSLPLLVLLSLGFLRNVVSPVTSLTSVSKASF